MIFPVALRDMAMCRYPDPIYTDSEHELSPESEALLGSTDFPFLCENYLGEITTIGSGALKQFAPFRVEEDDSISHDLLSALHSLAQTERLLKDRLHSTSFQPTSYSSEEAHSLSSLSDLEATLKSFPAAGFPSHELQDLHASAFATNNTEKKGSHKRLLADKSVEIAGMANSSHDLSHEDTFLYTPPSSPLEYRSVPPGFHPQESDERVASQLPLKAESPPALVQPTLYPVPIDEWNTEVKQLCYDYWMEIKGLEKRIKRPRGAKSVICFKLSVRLQEFQISCSGGELIEHYKQYFLKEENPLRNFVNAELKPRSNDKTTPPSPDPSGATASETKRVKREFPH